MGVPFPTNVSKSSRKLVSDLSLTVFCTGVTEQRGKTEKMSSQKCLKGLLSRVKSGSDSLGHNRNVIEALRLLCAGFQSYDRR